MYFLIEHLEYNDVGALWMSDWCRLEYQHILSIVRDSRTIDGVIFTNFPKSLASSLVGSLSCNKNPHFYVGNGAYFSEKKFCDILDEYGSFIQPDGSVVPWNRLCLLDMQGGAAMAPEDASCFDVFVFGGILGNIYQREDGSFGSDDVTSKIRDVGFCERNRRHLGSLQMTTDSAVLTSERVVSGKALHSIDFVDHPEIKCGCFESTVMEGFRYPSVQGLPVLPEGMLELLSKSMDDDLVGDII